jgi:sn-glycerol 3-phosphate transport system permease protein
MKSIKKLIRWIFYVLLIAIFFIPFYWMILTSVKTVGETLQFPPTFWVSDMQWVNFKTAFEKVPILKYTINSIIVTTGIIVCQLVTVVPAAYAFARYNFKGKNILFTLAMITMMIPGQLIFLPLFLMFSKFSLINSYWSLILPSATSAFGIFMLRQTFMQVPEELIEAARLDMASEFKIIYKVMLPIAKPTMVTLVLLAFIGSWNDYFWPLVMTTNDTVRTLAVGIVSLSKVDSGVIYHILMAGNVILIAPIFVVYAIAQKQMIKAFTYTGEK